MSWGRPLHLMLGDWAGNGLCLIGGLMLVGGVALIAAGAWVAGGE